MKKQQQKQIANKSHQQQAITDALHHLIMVTNLFYKDIMLDLCIVVVDSFTSIFATSQSFSYLPFWCITTLLGALIPPNVDQQISVKSLAGLCPHDHAKTWQNKPDPRHIK